MLGVRKINMKLLHLQPLPIPNRIWEDISLDFITRLPLSCDMGAILVVVDQLSKYAHFVALKYLCFAKTVADKFIKEIVKLHGIPKTIVSDCDSIFMSSF